MKFNIDETGTLLSVEGTDKENLESIEIPEGVKSIGESAFTFSKLKEIKFSKSLKKIGGYAFFMCKSLEKIEIPEGVETLGSSSFRNCSNLKEIKLPNSLKIIEFSALSFCESLEKVEIPKGVEVLDHLFIGCRNLKQIIFDGSLKIIADGMFTGCNGLEKMEVPEGIETIEDFAFSECENLKEVSLPSSLKTIGEKVFCCCMNLEKINIPPKVTSLQANVFTGCKNLKQISLENINSLRGGALEENIWDFEYFYFDKENKSLICSAEEIFGLTGYDRIDIAELKRLQAKYSYNRSEALMVLISMGKENFEKLGNNMKYILPGILNYCDLNMCEIENIDLFFMSKTFNALLKQLNKITGKSFTKYRRQYSDVFRFAYTLGACNDSLLERQTACEFIGTAFQQGYFDMGTIHSIIENMQRTDYSKTIHKEWSSFIRNKNNFKQLMELEKEQSGYIADIYNSFEKIKEFGRKSKGNQEYREITIEMCKEYFKKINFGNINERDVDIADELIKYGDLKSSKSFNEAISIRDEYLRMVEDGLIKEHILGESLKEKSVFEQIEEERISAINGLKDTLEILDELANKTFTYEFLSKYDAKNYTLGKYCSCCAHLKGAGYGIMKASILHPNCQNLIIRDNRGEIVSKSTLYINREQGYGVLNNIEVNDKINDEDVLRIIYDKYMKAINDFAKRYNEINKNKPLTQINVGMDSNDLADQITDNNKKSKKIFVGLHFYDYGKEDLCYDGNWKDEQYVVWSKNNKKR